MAGFLELFSADVPKSEILRKEEVGLRKTTQSLIRDENKLKNEKTTLEKKLQFLNNKKCVNISETRSTHQAKLDIAKRIHQINNELKQLNQHKEITNSISNEYKKSRRTAETKNSIQHLHRVTNSGNPRTIIREHKQTEKKMQDMIYVRELTHQHDEIQRTLAQELTGEDEILGDDEEESNEIYEQIIKDSYILPDIPTDYLRHTPVNTTNVKYESTTMPPNNK